MTDQRDSTYIFEELESGAFATGTTAPIQSVSRTPVVSTDVRAGGHEAELGSRTAGAVTFGTDGPGSTQVVPETTATGASVTSIVAANRCDDPEQAARATAREVGVGQSPSTVVPCRRIDLRPRHDVVNEAPPELVTTLDGDSTARTGRRPPPFART